MKLRNDGSNGPYSAALFGFLGPFSWVLLGFLVLVFSTPPGVFGVGMRIDSFSPLHDAITHSYTGVNESFYLHASHDSIFLVPGTQTPAWGTQPDSSGDVDLWPTTAMIGLGIQEWTNWGLVSYNNVTNDIILVGRTSDNIYVRNIASTLPTLPRWTQWSGVFDEANYIYGGVVDPTVGPRGRFTYVTDAYKIAVWDINSKTILAFWTPPGGSGIYIDDTYGGSFAHPVGDIRKREGYFPTGNGRLVVTNLDDTQTGMPKTRYYTVTVDDIAAMAITWEDPTWFTMPPPPQDGPGVSPDYNMLYIGSWSGLVVKWNTALLRIESIVFMSGPVRSLVFDSKRKVIFLSHDVQWSGPSRLNIVRIDCKETSMVVTDTVSISTNDHSGIRAPSLVLQDRTNTLTAFVANYDNNAFERAYTIQITNCSALSCSQCSSDPYCGFCGSSATCSLQKDCPVNLWSQDPAKCPALKGTPSPASVNNGGGTSVTLFGTLFYPSLSANYRCSFGGTDVAPSGVTDTTITCTAPSRLSTGSVTVSVSVSGRTWALPTLSPNFEYYDCQAPCDSCISSTRPECGWCLRSGRCTPQNQCATAGEWDSACPSTSLSLTSAENNPGNETLTVSVSRVLSSATYSCLFATGGSIFATTPVATTTVGQPGSVVCQTPVTAIAGEASVSVGIFNGSSVVPYSRSAPLELYSCAVAATPCFSCLGNHPRCRYCVNSFSCLRFNNTGACSSGLATTCPQLDYINPSSVSIDEAPTTNLLLIGSISPVANMTCDFGTPPRTIVAQINSSAWQCAIPASIQVGSRAVSIFTNNIQYTNPLFVDVYDCSVSTTCSSCLNRPQCVWCNSAGDLKCVSSSLVSSCTASTSLQRLAQSGQCPVIQSMDRNSDSTVGGRSVSVTLTLLPSSPSAICVFGGQETAANVTASAVECSIPPASTGVVPFYVKVGSKVYSDSVNFTYYDCENVAPFVPRTCAQCLLPQFDACTWCGSGCSARAACPSNSFTICPRVLSVTPNYAESLGGDVVSVAVQSFPTGLRAECVFGTSNIVVGALSGDGTQIQCITPSQAAGVTTLAIRVNGTTQFGDTVLPFTFSRCSEVPTCSGLCFDSAGICGWCVTAGTSGQCLSRTRCNAASAVESVWLNSTCISVASMQPDHMQVVASPAELPPAEDRMVNVSIPDFAAQLSWSTLNLSRLECTFAANVTTPVMSANGSFVSCAIPAGFSARSLGFYVSYDRKPLTQQFSFSYVDCGAVPRCRRCLTTQKCGWCANEVSCSTGATCAHASAALSIDYWLTEECPEARSVSPAIGETTGGLQITISGRQFAAGDGWTVKFDNATEVPAQRTGPTTIVATTPSFTRTGEVNVTVFYRGEQYVEDAVVFTFVNPLPVAAIGGGVGGAGFAIVASLAALGFILWRRRQREAFFAQLHEPDYSVIAYGDFLQPKFRTKADLDVLAIKLLAKDRALVFALENGTAPTESDMMSRCLIYIFYARQKSEELINALIANEVARSLSEGVLFRNNSLASKEFKFFSKMVGIKYLFHSFARFIHELNRLALEEARGTSVDSSTSLIAMSMEVDPNRMREGEDEDLSTDANALQLSLACQKIFNMICNSVKNMPQEFIRLFQQLQHSILAKYNDLAVVHRGIGGFLFLRLICPSITAPHAYGLLADPPLEASQRQLILIGKVIQNLANLTMPGAKEVFMQKMNDFFIKNMPRIQKFYDDILATPVAPDVVTEYVAPDPVAYDNALQMLWAHIRSYHPKLLEAAQKLQPDEISESAVSSLKELQELYANVHPKKIKEGSEKGGKDKGKKGRSTVE